MFIAKNSDATSCHELLHQFDPFCTECCMQPKSPKCTQIVRNAPKCVFRVQCVGSGAFIAKDSDATLWHEHLHRFCPYAPSFVRQQNSPKCTKIVRNAPKHEFRSQWGQSSVFVAKIYDVTSWHELFHQFGLFCT